VPADATVVDMAGIQQPDGARRPTSVGDASSEADPWSQYPSGSPALLMPSSRRVRWAVTAGLDVAYSIATYTARLLSRSPRCPGVSRLPVRAKPVPPPQEVLREAPRLGKACLTVRTSSELVRVACRDVLQ